MPKDTAPSALYAAYDEDHIFDVVAPEKDLLLAVLASAINDLGHAGDQARKATSFFLSEDEDYLFSFHSICQHLQLDSKRILMYIGLR